MRYILDTSALLSGKDFSLMDDLITSPKVLDELKHGKMRRKLDYLLEGGLQVLSPSDITIKDVRECAKRTGDIDRVSTADIEVLALAKEEKGTILTDDYSIQNLAQELGISFQCVLQKGIREVFNWGVRCTGCGRFFNELHSECPVCGSKLKKTRRK
jgi:UPF0271 protein